MASLNLRKYLLTFIVAAVTFTGSFFIASPSQAAAISIASQAEGRTPFIWNVTLSGVNTATLQSVQFSIKPKTGSVTQPISANYSAAYLRSQNRVDAGLGQVTIAVFGLYASPQTTQNNVTITVRSGGPSSNLQDLITTNAWNGYPYSSPTKVTPRNNRINLDYSYFYLRDFADGAGPVIVDTDGEVRWVGTTGCATPSFKFYQKSFFTACGNTVLYQNNLDGTKGPIFDYAGGTVHATYIGHHNYDIGKQGLLLEINANGNQEQEIIEVSPTTGQVYKIFDFSQIISQVMTAAGENPADFVKDGFDWFHNNAATYWPSQNELVVSSRENFVIAVDYTTQKIKWILGDPNKNWYKFASLRKFALKLNPGTTYPEGQHAVSITSNNQLLLFDNDWDAPSYGGGLLNPNPPYSAPRMYSINENRGTATETWQFLRSQTLWSPICSSIYQDGRSYLIDYASQGMWGTGNGIGTGPEVMGLDSNKNVAFDYYFPGAYTNGWNADPVHLENLQFTSSAPLLGNAPIPQGMAPIVPSLLDASTW
jgi:arylsulfate sulfotransferase